jgi:hypothetical protein
LQTLETLKNVLKKKVEQKLKTYYEANQIFAVKKTTYTDGFVVVGVFRVHGTHLFNPPSNPSIPGSIQNSYKEEKNKIYD